MVLHDIAGPHEGLRPPGRVQSGWGCRNKGSERRVDRTDSGSSDKYGLFVHTATSLSCIASADIRPESPRSFSVPATELIAQPHAADLATAERFGSRIAKATE